MREFISILISFILMGIADNVDNFFNNAISVDTIVVCGCIFTLDIVLNAVSQLGLYAYRTVRKNESAYIIINFISSLFVAFILFFTKDYIVNIFDITLYQKELLISVLSIYIFYLPVGRTSNAIFEMIRLKGDLKLYNKSLFLFYVCLILFDIIAFTFTHNLVMLFVATTVAWFISIIYMLYKLKLKFVFPNKEDFMMVKKYSIPTLFERVFTSGGALVYTIIASHLSTHDYAIYSVCFAVVVNLEIITDAYQAALMIKIPLNKGYNEQYKVMMDLKKKCFKTVILFNYVLCFLYLFITHGSLPLEDCLPFILFYSLNVFCLYPYETYRTLCVAQGKPTIVLKGAIAGALLGIFVYLAFVNTSIALIAFGLAGVIEFGTKYLVVKYLLNSEFKHIEKVI